MCAGFLVFFSCQEQCREHWKVSPSGKTDCRVCWIACTPLLPGAIHAARGAAEHCRAVGSGREKRDVYEFPRLLDCIESREDSVGQ